jgi:hypothetical protein
MVGLWVTVQYFAEAGREYRIPFLSVRYFILTPYALFYVIAQAGDRARSAVCAGRLLLGRAPVIAAVAGVRLAVDVLPSTVRIGFATYVSARLDSESLSCCSLPAWGTSLRLSRCCEKSRRHLLLSSTQTADTSDPPPHPCASSAPTTHQ